MKRRGKLAIFGVYLCLLLPSLILASCVWDNKVSGTLYYCSDSLPWDLFSLGPFAHLDQARYGNTGDYYVASEERLHLIQCGYLAVACAVPAVLLGTAVLLLRGRPALHRQTP